MPGPPFRADPSGAGQFTIGDALLWLGEAFFLPGDWAIWAASAYAPELAAFLEIGPAAYGGTFSGFLSALAWLALLSVLVVVVHRVRRFDDAVTRRLHAVYAGCLRWGRIWRIRLLARLGGGERAERAGPIDFDAPIALTADQNRALRVLLDFEPPGTLGTAEIARLLGVRPRHAQELLASLAKRRLLEAKTRGAQGDIEWTISSTGRAHLIFEQLAPKKTPPKRGN